MNRHRREPYAGGHRRVPSRRSFVKADAFRETTMVFCSLTREF